MASEKDTLPEGYIIPIHRALTKPLFWMGVPRNFLLMEFFFGFLGGVLFKTFYIPLLAVCCHFLFRYLGQRDSYFFDVFWRAKDYKSDYEP